MNDDEAKKTLSQYQYELEWDLYEFIVRRKVVETQRDRGVKEDSVQDSSGDVILIYREKL